MALKSREDPTNRYCRKCSTLIDISEYKPKRGNICHKCDLSYQRQFYKVGNEKYLAKRRERYYQANPATKRSWSLWWNYGITLEDYFTKLQEQNNKCKICGIDVSELDKDLAVDHCHKTNKVRGLLCFNCNAGLGNFRDKLQSLKQAVKYLEESYES